MSERFDDKEMAEGVSVGDHTLLHVEKGTIIHATRDFKASSLKEILEQNMVENPDRFVQPETKVGCWNKLTKKEITSQNPRKSGRQIASYIAEKPDRHGVKQLRKRGRGWLHAV